MKKFLIAALAAGLVLTSGCAEEAAPTQASEAGGETSEAMQTLETDSEPAAGEAEGTGAKPGSRQEFRFDPESTVIGKIVSVSETEITVKLADMAQPEPSELPAGSSDSPKVQPEDGERTRPSGADKQNIGDAKPERSEAGGKKSPNGGRGFVLRLDFEFDGEEKTYEITGSVAVTKGMGDQSEAVGLSDLSEGDVVRIELDDGGALKSLAKMEAPTPPTPPDTSPEASDAES